MKLNKGAMFGLDARIALAIFGALSVISGAALYSAIQESKTISLITKVKEIEKAYDSYQLDIGEELEIENSSFRWLRIGDLVVNNSKKGWNGPYLSYGKESDRSLNSSSDIWIYLMGDFLDGNWNSNLVTSNSEAFCGTGTVGGTCYIWTVLFSNTTGGIPFSLVDEIEKKIDRTIDYAKGDVRYRVSSSGPQYLYIKYRQSSRY